ncbi:MAG: hypothetical protein ACTSP3_12900 [Candidatus Heimdallarchaeaceae archaeon]
MNSRDYLVREVDVIRITRDPKLFDLITNEKFYPIVTSLRSGKILTLDEIVESYNLITQKPKKKITIYKYIKKLEELDIVTVVGQRVDPTKTASKILYARTAKFLFPLFQTDEYWKTDRSKVFAEKLCELLKEYYPTCSYSPDCLHELFLNIYAFNEKSFNAFIEEKISEISEIVKDVSLYQFAKIGKTILKI